MHHPVSTKTVVWSSSSNDLLVCAVRLPTIGRQLIPLSTISAHLQQTTNTASVSTFISWPSLINYGYSVWCLW